jgi:Zn-dependent protease with chaperone function
MQRTTFFDEQARYRRWTWRWTVVSAVAVAVMGLPLSLILTPVVYLVALVALHFTSRIVAVPPEVWAWVDGVGTLVPRALEASDRGVRAAAEVILPAAPVLIAPGALGILIVWHSVRRMLESVGIEATLHALGARKARPTDLEERQLANVVDEMAIAACMLPPALWINEQIAPNLALIGTSPDRAAIVVSRPLLNTCDRAETQALVAHLMASLAHNDPAIALRIESVYLTGAALNALVNAPFGPAGRRVVGVLLRALVRRAKPAEAMAALETLLQEWSGPSNDLTRFLERDSRRPRSVVRELMHLPLLPLYFLNMAVLITAGLLEAGLVGPILAAVWRTRRYLADASAVQLTRNPSDLARALHNISGSPGDPKWIPARLQTVVASDVTNPLKNPGGLTSSHPPVAKRIRRLEAQGAALPWKQPRTTSRDVEVVARPRRRKSVGQMAALVAFFPLLVVLAYLMLALVAFVTVLAMAAMGVVLAVIHQIFVLLR